MTDTTRFACTIASRNYVAYLRVFASTFLEHNPRGRVIACIVGRKGDTREFDDEPFETVFASELGIERFEAMAFRYDVVELNTAVKPYLLEYVHRRFGARHACYFDPDILVLDDLGELYSLVASHDAVLTPHVTEPIEDGATPSERQLLQTGIFNLGFAGFRFNDTTLAFLRWWQSRLYVDCRHDVPNGLFVDQKWMDFAPAFLADAHILRDPGYNVAYWNLRHRRLGRENDRWRVNGQPLRFFHFSGLDLREPEKISRYQPETSVSDQPDLRRLLGAARDAVIAAGHEDARGIPYDFDNFDDGTPVARAMRIALREADPYGERWPDPFRTHGDDAWLDHLRSSGDDAGTPFIPSIGLVVRDLDRNAANAFPEPLGASRVAFASWLVSDAAERFLIPEGLFARTLRELPASARRRVARTRAKRRLFRAALPAYLALKKRHPSVALVLKRKFNPEPAASSAQAASSPLAQGLNIIGWLDAPTGIGETSRAFLTAASAAGIPHAAVTLQDRSPLPVPGTAAPYDLSLYCANADMIQDVAKHVPSLGRYRIGLWFWELAHLPLWFADSFRALDELWAATRFCEEAFRPLASIPVRYVPPCVPRPDLRHVSRPKEANGRFLFFFTFDVRSVPQRKNPDGLLAAFRRAVAGSPVPLHLAIRVNHAKDDRDYVARLKRSAERLPVSFLEGTMDRATLDAYFAGADAYVALHRSEGFGIGLIEAMYARKPVVATGYSGVSDFLDETTGWCVPYDLVQLERTYGAYPRGAVWADPRIDAAAELMVSVATGGDTNRSRLDAAYDRVTSMYSPEAAGARLLAEFERIRRTR